MKQKFYQKIFAEQGALINDIFIKKYWHETKVLIKVIAAGNGLINGLFIKKYWYEAKVLITIPVFFLTRHSLTHSLPQ